jgi:anti-anti-sigma factor
MLLEVSGKLDAYWASTLSKEIESCVRDGAVFVTLDLAQVDFISSAGLRVLLIWLKQLKAINGAFSIVHPSVQVRGILDMSGLTDLLLADDTEAAQEVESPDQPFADGRGRYGQRVLHAGRTGTLEVLLPPAATVSAPDYPVQQYPVGRIGFGIGGIGEAALNAEQRFGEFLSLLGITVSLPAGGMAHPDYMMEDGAFVPRMTVYSGLATDADFSHELTFEAIHEDRGVLLSELAALALRACEAESVMLMMIAETVQLIGAALRVSPAGLDDAFAWPELRERFIFTTEPAAEPSITVLCGVASHDAASWLRPLDSDGHCHGHFHAASLTPRPLPAGSFEPQTFLRSLFDEERILAVLHLMQDDRHAPAVRESAFLRGRIWALPLSGNAQVSV